MWKALGLLFKAFKALSKTKVTRTFIEKAFNKNTAKILTSMRTQKGSITLLKEINKLSKEEKKALRDYFNGLLPTKDREYFNSRLNDMLELANQVPDDAFSPYVRGNSKFNTFSNKKGLASNKAKTQILQKTLRDNKDFTQNANTLSQSSSFSSSWLVAGNFVKQYEVKGVVFGSLTIATKQGNKTYTYFDVPLITYQLMKQAKGINGTGAGSVFWKTYLRGNFPVQSKARISKAIKAIEKRRTRIITITKASKTPIKATKATRTRRANSTKALTKLKLRKIL